MNDVPNSRFAGIDLLTLDCDGVLTDGGLYYAADGSELRRFNVRDGVGIKALMAAGIEVAFVTASRTEAISHRAAVLGVPHCLIGVEDKVTAVTALAADLGIPLERTAHIGDDINDAALLYEVGFAITVADATPDIKAIADFETVSRGGQGAVREVADHILATRAAASDRTHKTVRKRQ